MFDDGANTSRTAEAARERINRSLIKGVEKDIELGLREGRRKELSGAIKTIAANNIRGECDEAKACRGSIQGFTSS